MEHFCNNPELGNVAWKCIKRSQDGKKIDFTERPTHEILSSDTGIQINLSIALSDMEKALAIVSRTTKEHGLSGFQMSTDPQCVSGAFAIHFSRGEDHPEIVQSFINRLEHRLRAADINSGYLGRDLLTRSKPVNGSRYAFYHYGLFSARPHFQAPHQGDFMEDINVQRIAPRWQEKNNWRTIKDGNGTPQVCLDYIEHLSDVERHNLTRFLKTNDVPCDITNVTHRDKSVSQAIAIKMDAKEFFSLLTREEFRLNQQMEETRKKAWGNENSWRVIDNVAFFDNIEKMTIRSQLALREFLNGNGIACQIAPITHRDKSMTLSLQILENPNHFFSKLRQHVQRTMYSTPKRGR